MAVVTSSGEGGFDVAEFARTASGDLRERIDLAEVHVPSTSTELVGALGVLEGATMAHLRNVLVTATHKDARVTAFLVTWAFEKFWISDALRAVSGTDAAVGASLPGGPVRRATGGLIAGRAIVGAHMAAGYLDDLVLDAAYQRLETDAPPPLRELIAIVRGTKARHTAFFLDETTRRLTADARSARLAARSILHQSWPIGAPLLHAGARSAFTSEVFGGERGTERAEAISAAIGALPRLTARVASDLGRSLTKGA